MGDAAGVTWWRGRRRERARLPAVRDLAFDDRGRLWIATEAGLHRWSPGERPVRRRLGGGEQTERLAALAIDGAALVVASEAGAWWSTSGERFQPLPLPGTRPRVDRVALRLVVSPVPGAQPGGTRARVWLAGEPGLIQLDGIPTASGLRLLGTTRLGLPRPRSERAPIDLVVEPEGGRLHLVYPDLIASRPVGSPSSTRSGPGWTLIRPVLPPGAGLRALRWAAGSVWLVTDRGLLAGRASDGALSPVAVAEGANACVDLRAEGGDGVRVLCRSGLYRSLQPSPNARHGGAAAVGTHGLLAVDPITEAATEAAAPVAARAPSLEADALEADPPLAEIRRRALAHAGLEPERDRQLWRGLRRRGLWPELGLRFSSDLDRGDRRDWDQSFLSGDTRHLYDRQRDRGWRYEASIELDWALGELAYPSESVDLSRELRQVVSLRDDVADEINQLYHERQRLLERLAAGGPFGPGEAEQARWRAREIEAGLDAWTGGWIARWRRDRRGAAEPTPSGPRPDPHGLR